MGRASSALIVLAVLFGVTACGEAYTDEETEVVRRKPPHNPSLFYGSYTEVTLRDYFAAQYISRTSGLGPLDTAENAYKVADKMLEVRNRKR